jgi:hypothetical protein
MILHTYCSDECADEQGCAASTCLLTLLSCTPLTELCCCTLTPSSTNVVYRVEILLLPLSTVRLCHTAIRTLMLGLRLSVNTLTHSTLIMHADTGVTLLHESAERVPDH